MPDLTIAGAILAGGQARRFGGHDKSRLVIREGHPDSRTIIVNQRDLLQQVAGTIFIVTTSDDRRARPARFSDLQMPVVTDVVEGAGALGGIHAALAHACAAPTAIDRVLVLACDLPFLTVELLTALVAQASVGDGAWVRSARGPEPLIACYRCRSLDRITAALAAGERRAGALGAILTLAELGPDALAAFGDPARLTANVNTPDEWRRVQ
jgi:molybdopterin-guanine dinucleotide biosynthesis protein A